MRRPRHRLYVLSLPPAGLQYLFRLGRKRATPVTEPSPGIFFALLLIDPLLLLDDASRARARVRTLPFPCPFLVFFLGRFEGSLFININE
jgi:hypothetical protein